MYTAAAAGTRPPPTLRFSAVMRVGEGYGHSGDGCISAEAAVQNVPVTSRIVFDGKQGRLSQNNARLERSPTTNTTNIGRWDIEVPREWDITTAEDGALSCSTEPLPSNQPFGSWGQLNAFTSILGMFYPNTTLLASTPSAWVWQWSSVKPTVLPLPGCTGCTTPKGPICTSCWTVNVTRNYTYTVGKTASKDGTFPLLRYAWTQSIPDLPAKPLHRDCFIFDYQHEYAPGVSESDFEPPQGAKCSSAGSKAAAVLAPAQIHARLRPQI